ncbi:Uma2 family endonuclease [Nocardia sp. SYP-A9097]|uniref:Uma2 family endonuclease n=1 Tax=Nocardia sp. SYP-A9097 TaxID=2663237 RepID=UPI00129B9DBB|nr:Uma2 family endonuclease [Nocardia sp. SYP-A9097]MRH91845.1 Uma2 family endonuclease [Nocardia sp. SYP-A9097]
MTAVHESLMTIEEFEELARAADRITEGVRLEFIDGKLGAKAVPDGDHSRIMQWLIRIFLTARPDLFLTPEQGLKIERYRKGRARPDGALADADAFVGQGEWAAAGAVLLVVEITSDDQDTERRDRVEKPRAYADTGIPVYLLIDRDTCEITVHSEPNQARYDRILTVPFGSVVQLPEPVDVTLDTGALKDWVR